MTVLTTWAQQGFGQSPDGEGKAERLNTYTDHVVDAIAGVAVAVSGGYSMKSGKFQKRIESIDEGVDEMIGRG